MANGFKTVKPGRDIDSKNEDDFLYSSEFLSPKVYRKVPGKIKTNGSGNAVVIIEHDLGYPPAAVAYINPTISNANTEIPMTSSWGLADSIFAYVTCNVKDVRLDIENATANKEYRYVLFILVEPAKDE